MTRERWQLIKSVVESVESAAPDQRAEVLEKLCAGDTGLQCEAEKYLDDDGSGALIYDLVAQSAASLGAAAPGKEAASGKRIGPYRIVRLVGRGGQGAVYEAERDDGSFRQKVAVKILKWESDSGGRDRFQRERQILAGLDHPFIARLLDGGETDEGSPYLVMEYVEGVPLNTAVSTWNLRRKLDLFLKIADTVTFAHAKLIVHRDLKPGNILVTADERPKVLDFGIARLIDDTTPATETALRAFTPNYASPEQVLGEPITTASDVYSLGVVLYEMLAGRSPYDLHTTSPMEMHRAICLTPPGASQLDKDLDNILQMALRKEPARRYLSVQDFSDDVRRFVEYRPVKARKDSLSYRGARFFRRNRTGVAAALVLVASLTTAFVLTVRAERRAQSRFEQVRQLATTFLVDFDRDIRQLPGSTPARERLVSTALDQLQQLSKDSSNDIQLTRELVRAYASVGDVLGMPGLPSLGHTGRAEESYRQSCALADRLLKMDSRPSSPGRTRAAFSYARLGYLLFKQGRVPEARNMMLKAIALIGPKVAAPGAVADDFRAAANAYAYLAQLETREVHARVSEAYAAKALEFMRRYQKETPGLRAKSNLARTISIASTSVELFDLNRALDLRNESIALLRELSRENPNDVEVRRQMAVDLEFKSDVEDQPDGPGLGRDADAGRSIEEAIGIFRELARQDPSSASAKEDLAMSIQRLMWRDAESNPARAEAEAAEPIAIMNSLPATFGGRDRQAGILYTALAQAYEAQSKPDQALVALNKAEALFKTGDAGDAYLQDDRQIFWGVKGHALLRRGKPALALAELQKRWQGLAAGEGVAGENIGIAFQLAGTAGDLAAAYKALGDTANASAWQDRKAKIWKPWKDKYPATDRRLQL